MSRRWRATVNGRLPCTRLDSPRNWLTLATRSPAAKKQMILLAHLDGWLKARGHEAGELTADLVEPTVCGPTP